jgi:DNA-binding CsgD family transcriptional regulator
MYVATHLGALSSGPAERDRFGFDFLRAGLRRGDGCLCLIDDLEHARARAPRGRSHLDVHRARDVCVRDGRFSASRMTEFLVDRAGRSADDGLPRLRVTVEMDWLGQNPQTLNELLLYEASLEHLVTQVPALVMCLYDLHRCGVGMLARVLTRHRTVFVDGSMLVNPHFRAGAGQGAAILTDEAQGSPGGARRRRRHQTTAADRWRSLTGAELQIVAHVAAGLTNREVALLLVVSRHTVDAHLKHIFVKLGIHTRVELTVLALRHTDVD